MRDSGDGAVPSRSHTGATGIRPFHVMAKPVGPLCNLDCKYCFYLAKASLFPAHERFASTVAASRPRTERRLIETIRVILALPTDR